VAVGPIYDHDEAGTQFWGFRTQMNLPVWDTGGPLARQRAAEVQQRQAVLDQLRGRASLEAFSALDRYERARRLVAEYQQDLAISPTDQLRQVEAQYEAGQTDLLSVLQTQSALLQDQRAYLDMLNELAQASAAVVAATGLPPETLVVLK
jgi:cobalt-zinc-cadmium efflux system outer membrane protein